MTWPAACGKPCQRGHWKPCFWRLFDIDFESEACVRKMWSKSSNSCWAIFAKKKLKHRPCEYLTLLDYPKRRSEPLICEMCRVLTTSQCPFGIQSWQGRVHGKSIIQKFYGIVVDATVLKLLLSHGAIQYHLMVKACKKQLIVHPA